jgi:hypothetical protein
MSLDENHNGHSIAFGESSERIQATDGRDGEEFLTRACSDLAMTEPRAMEVYEWFDENMPLRQGEGGGSDSRGEHFWRRFMISVFSYQGPRAFALECAILALGTATRQSVWYDIIGCKNQVELSERWKVTKADVNKCVRSFQKTLNLPGERSDESKITMSEVRNGQLKQK